MIKQLVRSPKAWLAAFVLLDVLHRCIQLCASPFPLDGDAPFYWRLGEALARGEGLFSVDPEVIRTPTYPAFLAIFRALFGAHGLQAAIVGQNVLAMLASLVVALAGARITSRAWAAPLTYLVLLGCTGRVQYDQMIMTESLSGSLLALHGVGFVLGVVEARRRWWWLAGVAGALLVLTRPAMALLPVGEAVLLLTFLRPAGRPWLALALVLGAPACGIGAWVARNHAVTGRWALVGRGATHAWEHTFHTWAADLPLPPQAGTVLPAGTNVRNGWDVAAALDMEGWPVATRDAWMAQAVADAQASHPEEYWASVASAPARLWACIWEAKHWYLRDREALARTVPGQIVWELPNPSVPLSRVVRLAYLYPRWMVGAFSVLVFAACALLWRMGGRVRVLGIWGLAVMAYVSAVTALKMYPMYRYQVPLHIMMAFVAGCAAACLGVRGQGDDARADGA